MTKLWQQIDAAIQMEMLQVLERGDWRSYTGSCSERVRAGLGELLASSDVLLTSSGTAALEIALRAAKVEPGDHVLLSGYDYPGNFWAIERVGARPLLVDIEPRGWGVSLEQVSSALAKPNPPKAIVISHLHGELQKTVELRQQCERVGATLIEDACQAIGATVAEQPAASLGHIGIVSFGGGKLVSAGRGGAAVTSDPPLAARMKIAAGAGSGPYEMSEVAAAIVAAQLPWLASIVDCGREFFCNLYKDLQTLPLDAAWHAECDRAAFYQAGVQHCAKADQVPQQRRDLSIEKLRARGYPVGHGFSGFHRRSSRRCDRIGSLDNAHNAAETTFVIHHRVSLDYEQSEGSQISKVLSEVCQHLI